ncbi:putative aminoglycoside phosphotransferase [Frankia torreyi]|uniref:Putative aminoglycoside phosphotransferase n=1 Tax=Frankia torreyi TaxID=1856 RepID=A0A0D8BH99_9ACTN|nr:MULTISPECIES: phosphotransferase family protein [Frankia]KJE23344.1 putative aminoglycoside phosphotransferase [Frankia torreyi]
MTAVTHGVDPGVLRALLAAGRNPALADPVLAEPVLAEADIVDLHRLKGGYSREMWSFDAVTRDGATHPLILCADSAVGVVGAGGQTLGRPAEAALLHTLHTAGLPVPDAVASGDGATGGPGGELGRPYLVMERCSGTAAIGPLHRDPWYVQHRAELADWFAATLAAIHAADVPADILGARPDPARVAGVELARWSGELRATPRAHTGVLDRALGWLAANPPPPPVRVTLLHGDYRTGNILHGHGDGGPDGLRTVLDWEMAHVGDPLEDLAWAQLVCWRVGTDRVGGLVDLARWPDLYGAAAGWAPDLAALRWWEVLGSVKMACLVWRAAEAVTVPAERALLERLFADLGTELDRRLLPPDRRPTAPRPTGPAPTDAVQAHGAQTDAAQTDAVGANAAQAADTVRADTARADMAQTGAVPAGGAQGGRSTAMTDGGRRADVGPATESFEVRGVRNGSIVTVVWDRGVLDGDPPTIDLVEVEADLVAESRRDPLQRRRDGGAGGGAAAVAVNDPESAFALVVRTLDRVVQVTTPARPRPSR